MTFRRRPARLHLVLCALAGIAFAPGIGAQSDYERPDGSLFAPTDSAQAADTASAAQKDTAGLAQEKLSVVKRDFDFDRQIGVALVVTGFIAVMMLTAQEFNPR